MRIVNVLSACRASSWGWLLVSLIAPRTAWAGVETQGEDVIIDIIGDVLEKIPLGVDEPANDPPYEDKDFFLQRQFKHLQYSLLARNEAENIAQGRAQPLIKFEVVQDPPSLYINWKILDSKVDELVEFLNFPSWLDIVPVTILEDEEPLFYLTLNIYGVNGLGGLLAGLRAEWSIYVARPGERPSFMVVDVAHTGVSLDSVNGFNAGVDMKYENTTIGLFSFIPEEEENNNKMDKSEKRFGEDEDDSPDTYFESFIPAESLRNADRILPTRQWCAANDIIYWRNGIADHAYYNGLLYDTPVLSVDPSDIDIIDNSIFKEFIDEDPLSVLVYQTGLELVIIPWFNLDDLDFA